MGDSCWTPSKDNERPGVQVVDPVKFKDLWQHRRHHVANTRWWPPFCLVVDWVVAAILVVLIAAGVDFHH